MASVTLAAAVAVGASGTFGASVDLAATITLGASVENINTSIQPTLKTIKTVTELPDFTENQGQLVVRWAYRSIIEYVVHKPFSCPQVERSEPGVRYHPPPGSPVCSP